MRLAILGASGHGKVVADTALQAGWKEVVFFDDAWPRVSENGAWSVAGGTATLFDTANDFDGVVVGIGNNATRLAKTRKLLASGAPLVTIIHPNAVVSAQAELGIGSVVFAGVVIQADCYVGMACIVNTRASLDHDCTLADGVHISPGAALAGYVKVGEGAWVGIGAAVKQLVSIGRHAVVGAGAAVIKDVAAGSTVVGVPARPV
ncbi:acetyltransferase [uncultured Halomonas sp.]|uniref:acetyltransferase n=1 Tax=uncultured Halomonas sp. TaxID=173971 RepID=UPI0026345E86|nr:acetyltransferase [uncultured Halomonas sp.]